MSEKNNNEIDLIELVKSINSGLKSSIKSFINFLGKVLLFLYNQIHLLFKTFLQYKFIALAVIILPTLIAFIIKANRHCVYIDSLVIKTNTKELNYQLYKNISEYNLLIDSKKTNELSSKLKIDTSILNKIISFSIKADVNIIEQNKIISNIISSRDTNITEKIDLNAIKSSIKDQLYTNQIITIRSKDQINFNVFQKAIINHIENSSNVLKLQNRQVSILKEQINNNNLFIKDLDTLKRIYENEIIAKNNLKSSKISNNKSVDPMTMLLLNNLEINNKVQDKPLEIFEKRNKLISENTNLQNKLDEIKKKYYITIISSFSSLGQLDENHIRNKLPVTVFKWSLLILFFGLLYMSIQNQLEKLL